MRPAHVEGFERAEWVLLDYFDFVVHVFSSERREFYALERLWGSAERVALPEETRAAAHSAASERARERGDDVRARSAVRLRSSSLSLNHAQSAVSRRSCRTCRTASWPSCSRPRCLACGAVARRAARRPRLRAAAGAPSSPVTPPLCARCGDALPAWRGSTTCPASARAAGAARRRCAVARAAGAYEGVLRAAAALPQVRGPADARRAAGRDDAGRGGGGARGRGLRRAGAAPLAAPARARVQPGGRPRARTWACRSSARCGACEPPRRSSASARRGRRRNLRGAFAPPRRGVAAAAAGTTRGCAAPAWCWSTT